MADRKFSRNRVAIIILTGGIVSACALTYAFAAESKVLADNSQQPWLVLSVLFSGITQLGSTALLVKKYMGKVDTLAETTPSLLATLEAHKTAMELHARNIEELFNSRNDHNDNLTEINTVHKLKGCMIYQGTERRSSPRSSGGGQ